MERGHKYYPETTTQKLGYLAEECGEVLAAAGKSIRWGLESYNPEIIPEEHEEPELNGEWLARELKDLKSAISIMEEDLKRLGYMGLCGKE